MNQEILLSEEYQGKYREYRVGKLKKYGGIQIGFENSLWNSEFGKNHY